MYPQALLKPISDHNIVAARLKILGRFARNRPVMNVKKPPIERRRLSTDPYLREEVARAIGDRLRATPPNGSSVDEVKVAFTAAVVQTTELIVPPQERRMLGLDGMAMPRRWQSSVWPGPQGVWPGVDRGRLTGVDSVHQRLQLVIVRKLI